MKKHYNHHNEYGHKTLQEAVNHYARHHEEDDTLNVTPDDFAFTKWCDLLICFYVLFENGVELYIPISDSTLAPYRNGEEHMIQYEHDYKRFHIWYDSYAVEVKDWCQDCSVSEQWHIKRVDALWKDVLPADKILEVFKDRKANIFKDISRYHTHYFEDKKLRPHFIDMDKFLEYMNSAMEKMKKCHDRSDLKGFSYVSMDFLFIYALFLREMSLPLTPLWNDFFHSMMYDSTAKTSPILEAWFDEMDEVERKFKLPENVKP